MVLGNQLWVALIEQGAGSAFTHVSLPTSTSLWFYQLSVGIGAYLFCIYSPVGCVIRTANASLTSFSLLRTQRAL